MLKLRDWIDINMLDWDILSLNINAMLLLKENKNKIDWDNLSKNPNTIELLKENQDKINWRNLSANPNAINLLKENQNKIDWDYLSENPNAIELLKENQDKIDWFRFTQNPNIFTYDYIKMKETMKKSGIAEELMAFIFNPKNMNKWKDWGFSDHHEMLEFINNNIAFLFKDKLYQLILS